MTDRGTLSARRGRLFAVLASREFWSAFCGYWFGDGLADRLDDWTHRTRVALGLPPDEALERRRAIRGA